jgi:NitT/TauT family transport system substrate-binding protein
MRFRKARGTVLAAVAVIAVLAGCSKTSSTAGASATPIGPLEKTSITVDAFPAIDSVGLFIAQDEGLFKAQGLNVTIKLATNSQAAINGQLAGSYDITSADYVTYIDNVLLKKAPLRIVAESSFLQPNVLALVTKSGSAIKSLAQLKHRVVSVNAPNDIGTLLVDSVLSENNIAPASVKFNNSVEFPAVAQELATGKVSAAFVPEPFVSLDAMQAGTEELADLDQGSTTDFPIQGVAVTKAWAQANPNTLAAFQRAYSQAQEIADTDRPAVEQALESKAFLGLPAIAAALVSLPSFPTGVDSIRLQRLVDAMVKYKLLGPQFSTFKISSIIENG